MDKSLKKEVDRLLSQGYSLVQIKQALTQKGYTIAEIEGALVEKPGSNNKSFKNVAIIGAIVLVLIVAISSLFIRSTKLDFADYQKSPSDWIIDKEGGVKEISIGLVTGGKTFVDAEGLQYRSDDIKTMFSSYGYYQGQYFENDYEKNNIKLMSINTVINPTDGIIEGYFVFNIVNDSPVFYIFLDEDWKNKVSPTKIMYGFQHSKVKDFEFKEISEGIYMDSVTDDKDNYDKDYKMHLGSLLIGDISDEKISSQSDNLTMIVIK